jgi:hypothetical protein
MCSEEQRERLLRRLQELLVLKGHVVVDVSDPWFWIPTSFICYESLQCMQVVDWFVDTQVRQIRKETETRSHTGYKAIYIPTFEEVIGYSRNFEN